MHVQKRLAGNYLLSPFCAQETAGSLQRGAGHPGEWAQAFCLLPWGHWWMVLQHTHAEDINSTVEHDTLLLQECTAGQGFFCVQMCLF